MITITANVGDTERLMSSVCVGMWTWDGRNDQLILDPVSKSFYELGWDDKAPEELP